MGVTGTLVWLDTFVIVKYVSIGTVTAINASRITFESMSLTRFLASTATLLVNERWWTAHWTAIIITPFNVNPMTTYFTKVLLTS